MQSDRPIQQYTPVVSSHIACKRKQSDSVGEHPLSRPTGDPTNRNFAARREAPASLERISADRWENSVARENARVHNGHNFIQNHYSGRASGPQQAAQDDVQRVSFVKALRFDYMDSRYESIDAAHMDTCRWLFHKSEYVTWRSPEHFESHYGFLWIKGKAGSGKSTLMKCALKHAEQNFHQDKVISFFFNARGQQLERSVEGMYRSLLSQLLHHFPHLAAKLPKYGPGPVGKQSWTIIALRNHLETVLRNLEQGDAVTIYVDALDECDEDDIREAIENFEDLCSAALSNGLSLHICFASRYYPRVTMQRCIELHFDQQLEHQQDIKTYINHRLRIRDDVFKAHVASQIETRSSGVFFWVVLVVRLIGKKCDAGALHSQLLDALRKVPDKLHEMIGAILHSPDDALICAMRWVVYAQEPLTLEELYFAIRLAIDQPDPGVWEPVQIDSADKEAFVLASSRGLIEQGPSNSFDDPLGEPRTMQLVHESVREYIIADGFRALGLSSNEQLAANSHFTLFRLCQLCLKSAEDPIAVTGHADPQIHSYNGNSSPLLEYAAVHILAHFEDAYSAGLLSWTDMCGIPLGHVIHITFGPNIRQWLQSRQHAVALLYILIFEQYDKLLEVLVVANFARSSFLKARDPISVTNAGELLHGSLDLDNCFGGGCSGSPEEAFFSPLTLAIRHGTDTCVRLLLEHGANANIGGHSPLRLAIHRGLTSVATLLLSHGAKVDDHDALLCAIKTGNLSLVRMLLQKKADANGMHERTSISPLLTALGLRTNNYFDSHDNLFPRRPWDQGFSLDIFNATAEDLTCELLKHGADMHLKAGPHLITPLQYAVESWGEHMVRVLLDYSAQNQGEMIPLLVRAASKLNVEVVHFLLKRGICPGTETQALEAALLAADSGASLWSIVYIGLRIEEARFETVSLLLKAGADLTGVGAECKTALEAASVTDQDELIKALQKSAVDARERWRRIWFD